MWGGQARRSPGGVRHDLEFDTSDRQLASRKEGAGCPLTVGFPSESDHDLLAGPVVRVTNHLFSGEAVS
eukprot:7945035-Alexandrium_andersonii.AAC.1